MGFINRLLSVLKNTPSDDAHDVVDASDRARQLIDQGNALEDCGDLVAARTYYREAVQLAPQMARAHLNLGNVLQALGQFESAIAAYQAAVELQPDFAGAHLNLGNANMRMQRYAAAVVAYDKAVSLDDQQPDTYFAQAMALESLNRLEEALIAVQKSIALQPENSLAYGLEGNLLAALGRHQDAVASFHRALHRDPSYFLAWTSLGDSELQLGCLDEALECYQRGAQVQSGVALLHMKIATTFQMLGKQQPALREMKRAIELDPNSSVISFNAANLFDECQDYSAAMEYYQRALAIRPDAQTYNNLGNVQKKLGDLDEAFASFQQALAMDARCLEAHCNLGLLFQQRGLLDKALASLETALSIDPDSALVHCNLATVLLDLYRIPDALIATQRALELNPNMVEAINNLGNVLLEMGQLEEAAVNFERAMALSSSFTRARYNLSHARLAMGQLAQGWPNYEFRVDEHRHGLVPSPLPQWKGQPTEPGDRILIFVEQGLGDMLQFVRYLPQVAQRFPAGVALYALKPLIPLFQRSFPMITVLDTVPADQTAWQWQCPLLSLPLAFGTVVETVPNRVPYLVPDPLRCATWKARVDQLHLPQKKHKKIGIVWKPGTGMKIAPLKATRLQTLAPLFQQPGCIWFSLQKEPDPELAPWVVNQRIIDWSAEFHDFDDTAALAVNLDLVISVDTSVAHLAGGLGLPTWLLNRFASDWRWMRGRDDSPWYPTLRIFAQTQPGDWDGVVHRLQRALAE